MGPLRRDGSRGEGTREPWGTFGNYTGDHSRAFF